MAHSGPLGVVSVTEVPVDVPGRGVAPTSGGVGRPVRAGGPLVTEGEAHRPVARCGPGHGDQLGLHLGEVGVRPVVVPDHQAGHEDPRVHVGVGDHLVVFRRRCARAVAEVPLIGEQRQVRSGVPAVAGVEGHRGPLAHGPGSAGVGDGPDVEDLHEDRVSVGHPVGVGHRQSDGIVPGLGVGVAGPLDRGTRPITEGPRVRESLGASVRDRGGERKTGVLLGQHVIAQVHQHGPLTDRCAGQHSEGERHEEHCC